MHRSSAPSGEHAIEAVRNFPASTLLFSLAARDSLRLVCTYIYTYIHIPPAPTSGEPPNHPRSLPRPSSLRFASLRLLSIALSVYIVCTHLCTHCVLVRRAMPSPHPHRPALPRASAGIHTCVGRKKPAPRIHTSVHGWGAFRHWVICIALYAERAEVRLPRPHVRR